MSDANEQFDDPALKLALRRAMPAIACPEALRARIQQAAADLTPDAPIPLSQPPTALSPSRFQFFRVHRLAIAASILGLVGGIALFQFAGDDTEQLAAGDTAALQPVAYSLATQDAGLSGDPLEMQHHAQPMSQENLVAASRSLQRDTGQSLPLDVLAAAGWRFHGADECRLDNLRGTHLVFLRPNQTLSVFILPAQAAGNLADGKLYTMTAGRKPIAAAVYGQWLICMVGTSTDGSLKADTLTTLLKQVLPPK